jgi:hypothetical protein
LIYTPGVHSYKDSVLAIEMSGWQFSTSRRAPLEISAITTFLKNSSEDIRCPRIKFSSSWRQGIVYSSTHAQGQRAGRRSGGGKPGVGLQSAPWYPERLPRSPKVFLRPHPSDSSMVLCTVVYPPDDGVWYVDVVDP